ncbi:hypothetical protein [Amygdalobacter nucleatus]|uniref:hypothetical protein n=1 Tax=Amygdalobacter nucleatus TaxID=3029274 RepID=UPI0008367E9C|nr:hypothetical protein [Amygdalobacter nucleatus]WEG36686.1 hypothetical protein PYS63_05985 [Amygdalobacter nucleatus]
MSDERLNTLDTLLILAYILVIVACLLPSNSATLLSVGSLRPVGLVSIFIAPLIGWAYRWSIFSIKIILG